MSDKPKASEPEKSGNSDADYLSPVEHDHSSEKAGGSDGSASADEHHEKVLVKMKVKRRSGISKSLVKVKRSRIQSVSKVGAERSSSAEQISPVSASKSRSSEEGLVVKHQVKVKHLVKSTKMMKVKVKKRKMAAGSDTDHSSNSSSSVSPSTSSTDGASDQMEHTVVNSTEVIKQQKSPEAVTAVESSQQKLQPKENSKSSTKKTMPDVSAFVSKSSNSGRAGGGSKSDPKSKATVASGSVSQVERRSPHHQLQQIVGGRAAQEATVAPNSSLDASLFSLYIIIGAILLACLIAFWKMS